MFYNCAYSYSPCLIQTIEDKRGTIMAHTNIYLNFMGQTEEAFNFYRQVWCPLDV